MRAMYPPRIFAERWVSSAAIILFTALCAVRPAAASSASDAWNACKGSGPMFFMMHRPYASCIAVTPATAQIPTNATQQFTATVNVTWSASGGTISSSGLFSSSVAGTYTVKAASAANPSVFATATVTVSANQTRLLNASPSSVDFGSLTAGTSLTQAITLTNAGTADVTISAATLTGIGFSFSGATFPLTIAAGASQNVTITFLPPGAKSYAGSISFASDASNSPALVTLSGTGLPVQHSVDLTWVDGGSTIAGYNVYRSTQAGGPFTKINSALDAVLAYTDATVQSGATYYYEVTAVDNNAVESAPSAAVSAIIPTP